MTIWFFWACLSGLRFFAEKLRTHERAVSRQRRTLRSGARCGHHLGVGRSFDFATPPTAYCSACVPTRYVRRKAPQGRELAISDLCGETSENSDVRNRVLERGACHGRHGLTCAVGRVQPPGSLDQEAVWQIPTHTPTSPFFERTSKRRKGFPSETQVKKGLRIVHGDKELLEKLGRNDPCPCGSSRRFKNCRMRGGCFRRLGSPLLFSASSRPPDAAAPGRLRTPPADARPRRLPSLLGSNDHLRRPHVAPGLPPMIPRGSRALRCGRRRSSRRLPAAS